MSSSRRRIIIIRRGGVIRCVMIYVTSEDGLGVVCMQKGAAAAYGKENNRFGPFPEFSMGEAFFFFILWLTPSGACTAYEKEEE